MKYDTKMMFRAYGVPNEILLGGRALVFRLTHPKATHLQLSGACGFV